MKNFEYTDGDYKVTVTIHEDKPLALSATISSAKGQKEIGSSEYGISKPRELPPIYAAGARKAGLNPKDYVLFRGEVIRKGAEKMLIEAVTEYKRILSERIEAERKTIAEAVPGLEELRAAHAAEENWHREFNRRMEDENLSSFIPAAPTNSAEIASKFPVAALYLRCEGYEYSSHYAKSGAGRRAKALVLEGKLDEAKAMLDGWADGLDID